jgi:hypothetical protein
VNISTEEHPGLLLCIQRIWIIDLHSADPDYCFAFGGTGLLRRIRRIDLLVQHLVNQYCYKHASTIQLTDKDPQGAA